MSQAHMDELCDTCGDIGVPDAIAICCRCKISSEHCYCMRIFHQLPPEDWCCEECERNNVIVSPTSGMREDLPKASSPNTSSKLQHDLARPDRLPNNLTQNSMDRKKRIPTGKVKPLSPREVILLSSGAKKCGSPIKLTFCQNTVLQKSKSFRAERTQVKFGAVPPKFSSHLFRANPTLGPSKRLKAPRAIQAPPKEHIQKVRSINAITGVANFRMAQSSVEKAMPEESDVSSPLMDGLAITNSGKSFLSVGVLDLVGACILYLNRHERFGTAEPKVARPMNVLSTVDTYVPALDATWKGSYRILDNPKYEGKKDGIQACPPSRMNLFQNDCPDGKDVGLYFFPSNSERFENYISLLEHIGSKDLVMRTLLNGVELLVFTSKLLRENFQRWNGRYFLWGFFHRVKEDRASVSVDMEVDMVSGQIVGKVDSVKEDRALVPVDMEVDMEVDMLAGQIVGTVDIVVPRERILLPSVDARKDVGIPPGFERAYLHIDVE